MYVAQVDENTNKVIKTIVVRRDACMTGGVVTQAATEAHCDPRYGAGYKYYPVLSSTINTPDPGWNYDAAKDMYFEDAPFASWILDETTGEWEAPVDFLDQNGTYQKRTWNEGSGTWYAKKTGDMDGNFWSWNKTSNVWEDTGSTTI